MAAVRLSVGMLTTEEEIHYAARALVGAWRRLNKP
jgi:cysteine sulfinate desulfinase/cysteine desulfurase-like protein